MTIKLYPDREGCIRPFEFILYELKSTRILFLNPTSSHDVENTDFDHHSLVDISERSGLKFGLISEAADILAAENLLKEYNEEL